MWPIFPYFFDIDVPCQIIVGSPHFIPDWVYYFKTNRYGTKSPRQVKPKSRRLNDFRRRMF